jgi:O-antigen/teichoic acid export membrane protein
MPNNNFQRLMSSIKTHIKVNTKMTDKGKKSISLFATMVVSLVIGILISIINTRYLGKEQYGDFKFLINLFSLAVTFLTFGSFYTGGLLLAKMNEPEEKRLLTGDIIKLAAFSSLLLIIISFIFSFFEHKLFGNNLGSLIRYSLPLLFIFPFTMCFEQLLQGSNRIYSLSVLRIGPKLIYLALALGLHYFSSFNLTSAILSHLVAFALVIVVIIFLLKPKFTLKSFYLSALKKEHATFGFPVYLGAITGVASSYLAGITISYYVDNVNVGFYSLAITATMPLTMLPSSFGITFFKAFVTYSKIPLKIIIVTLILGLSALAVFLLFIDKIVIFLYTEDFKPVISLCYYIAIGSLFHGFGDFLNRFISAKGLGKKIMRSNFILGAFNTIGFLVLPKYFGVEGAAYTRLIAGLIYFSILLAYYINYQKQNIVRK